MEMNFCRRCGLPLDRRADHVYSCNSGHTIFTHCAPAVGVFLLTTDNRVMLSVRGIEPHKGMLDAFGGFVDGEEPLEAALARELKEELGLGTEDYDQPTYLISGIGHYPYKNEIVPVLSTLFWTRLKPGVKPLAADDVAAIETIALDDIDPAKLHDNDIRVGIRALRGIINH
jgi:NAD+ diphosphatase